MSGPSETAGEMLAALRLLSVKGHVSRADIERWEQALAGPDGGRLAAIRAVLDEADAGDEDLALVLARVDQLANCSRTESGVEPGGGAYLTPSDRGTALDALDVASDELRDRAANCSDCDGSPDGCTTCESRHARADHYDRLAGKLGGAS